MILQAAADLLTTNAIPIGGASGTLLLVWRMLISIRERIASLEAKLELILRNKVIR